MIILCLFYAGVIIMLLFLHMLIDEMYDSDELPLIQMVLQRRIVETQEEVDE